MTTLKKLHADFYAIKAMVYDKCDLEVSDAFPEAESLDYGACNFQLNGKKIKFRVAKITPRKTGQFVAIWKRDDVGATKPFDVSDEMDFLVIATRNQSHFGQFIFPRSVLVDKQIITQNNKEGKRGMRLYAPWDIAGSNQAKKTQSWQINYFLPIRDDHSTDLELAGKLLGLTSKSI